MPYESPGALRDALEARLLAQSQESGISLQRLRRRAAFERFLVRLELASPGKWVLKGGMALEVRLRGRARSTRDVDLVLMDEARDGEAVREGVIEAVSEDPQEDGFEFPVGPLIPLRQDEAGRPGWRLPVEARLDGRLFEAFRADIVPRAEEVSATRRVPLLGVLDFAGKPVIEIEVVDSAQHFAEKLHAYTRDYGDRPTSRVRDLPDMVLLVEDGLEPSRDLVDVVRHVFEARRLQPVPDQFPDPPAGWEGRYAEIVGEMDIAARTLGEAVALLREFWARTVATAKEG